MNSNSKGWQQQQQQQQQQQIESKAWQVLLACVLGVFRQAIALLVKRQVRSA
jgi:hypothetical protein